MSHIIEIDRLLTEISRPLAREADTLLDLRSAASTQRHPGRCVSCYFKLLQAAADDVARLTPLRRWLEQNIEITASDTANQPLDRFPLDLQTHTTLEACCQRSMNTVMEDRHYGPTRNIALKFRFRPHQAVV